MFLQVGDTSGLVTLHNRKTGERVYSLNSSCGSVVNKIIRVGRWIFCAYDTQLAVYDINRSDCHAPVQLFVSTTREREQVIIDLIDINNTPNKGFQSTRDHQYTPWWSTDHKDYPHQPTLLPHNKFTYF